MLHDSGDPATAGPFLLQVGFVTLTAVFAGHLADLARAAELALASQLDRARALHAAGWTRI